MRSSMKVFLFLFCCCCFSFSVCLPDVMGRSARFLTFDANIWEANLQKTSVSGCADISARLISEGEQISRHQQNKFFYRKTVNDFKYLPFCLYELAFFSILIAKGSPWYNRNGWLGVKLQVTYFSVKVSPMLKFFSFFALLDSICLQLCL